MYEAVIEREGKVGKAYNTNRVRAILQALDQVDDDGITITTLKDHELKTKHGQIICAYFKNDKYGVVRNVDEDNVDLEHQFNVLKKWLIDLSCEDVNECRSTSICPQGNFDDIWDADWCRASSLPKETHGRRSALIPIPTEHLRIFIECGMLGFYTQGLTRIGKKWVENGTDYASLIFTIPLDWLDESIYQ